MRVEVGDGRAEVEDARRARRRRGGRDLGVGADELAEVALLVPGAHRVSLHEAVRVVALEAALDEREQQAVREEEAVRGPEVPLHALRVDDEPVDDPA